MVEEKIWARHKCNDDISCPVKVERLLHFNLYSENCNENNWIGLIGKDLKGKVRSSGSVIGNWILRGVSQRDSDGSGQRSCKCNYVDFYKDARPPC